MRVVGHEAGPEARIDPGDDAERPGIRRVERSNGAGSRPWQSGCGRSVEGVVGGERGLLVRVEPEQLAEHPLLVLAERRPGPRVAPGASDSRKPLRS